MQIKSKLELRITKAIQNKDRNKLDDILVKEKLTKEDSVFLEKAIPVLDNNNKLIREKS